MSKIGKYGQSSILNNNIAHFRLDTVTLNIQSCISTEVFKFKVFTLPESDFGYAYSITIFVLSFFYVIKIWPPSLGAKGQQVRASHSQGFLFVFLQIVECSVINKLSMKIMNSTYLVYEFIQEKGKLIQGINQCIWILMERI